MTTATSGLMATTSLESVVHLVDQDPRSRDRVGRLLRTAYLPYRSYQDADDFLTRVDDNRPGCVLMTLRAPSMTGLRTQQRLSGTGSTLSVIFLGDSPPVSAAIEAIRAGAEDFLATRTDDETLIQTVQRAIARDRRRKARKQARRRLRERLASLTPRERQTLEAVVAGLSNKGIAEILSISPKTVELHRAHMMRKMRADSVAELVKLYLFATADAATPLASGFPLPDGRDNLTGQQHRGN